MSSATLGLLGYRQEQVGEGSQEGIGGEGGRALLPEQSQGQTQLRARELTFPMTDAVGGHRPPNVDDATTVGHFILIGVLARVIIIQGMHDAQIEEEFVQYLREMRSDEFITAAPLPPEPGSPTPHAPLPLAP